MSHLCRLVSRSTSNMLHVSRMQAHSLAPGTAVKVPEAKSGHHIVSGSGQFIATDGPNAAIRSGIGGGSSANMLPGAQTNFDSAHHTKSTNENKQSQSQQSIFSSPVGQFGVAAVAIGVIYGAYSMLGDSTPKKKGSSK